MADAAASSDAASASGPNGALLAEDLAADAGTPAPSAVADHGSDEDQEIASEPEDEAGAGGAGSRRSSAATDDDADRRATVETTGSSAGERRSSAENGAARGSDKRGSLDSRSTVYKQITHEDALAGAQRAGAVIAFSMAIPEFVPTSFESTGSSDWELAPDGTLIFEFWNDRRYQALGSDQQSALNRAFKQEPRESEVAFADGKYIIKHFHLVETGKAMQVNVQTKFERAVRIRAVNSTNDPPPKKKFPKPLKLKEDTPADEKPAKKGDVKLYFEYWNDTQFTSFKSEQQKQLRAAFSQKTRPETVDLADGKHAISQFGLIETGKAVQINKETKLERSVRIKPPYTLPGAKKAVLPEEGFHFQFLDDLGWRVFPTQLQQEMRKVAQCAPLPNQALFQKEGKAYWILGWEQLLEGGNSELVQMNAKTGNPRRVIVCPGLSENKMFNVVSWVQPTALSPANSDCEENSSSSSPLGFFAKLAGVGGSKENPNGSKKAPKFTLSMLEVTALCGPGRGIMGIGPLSPQPTVAIVGDAKMALLEAWRKEPRPEAVCLPGGDLVEAFDGFEFGKAGISGTPAKGPIARGPFVPSRPPKVWMPLKPSFPTPQPGKLTLPQDLEIDKAFDIGCCGSYLDADAVKRLHNRGPEANKCSICFSAMDCSDFSASDGAAGKTPIFELRCKHVYHTECLKKWFEQRKRCPQCQKDYGPVNGNQPKKGTMRWHLEEYSLPGHPDARHTIVAEFEFPPGTEDNGTQYEGRSPKGYLPCNVQGIILLELFKVAFKRRVMFGLGTSMTYGAYRPTFNIHIKTSTQKGAAGHGYPDDSYFSRALDELRANGVTLGDLALQ